VDSAAIASPDGTPLPSIDGQPIKLYRKGDGPAVLVLQELPGLTPATLRLVDDLADRGFRVYYPLLFGGYGESRSGLGQILRVCRTGEFHCLSKDKPAEPLIAYIQSQVFPLMQREGASKTVVLGMCLTGPVGLALLPNPFVAGAVMSQPALPFAVGRARTESLGISDDERKEAVRSTKPILAFRFTKDCISPPERMSAYEHAFEQGQQITVMQFDSGPGNRFGISHEAHSVLTFPVRSSDPAHPANVAFNALVEFLNRALKGER
jgi:dienelactone hydrolase